jgi:cholesterol transport system auxiliary component
MNDRLIRLCYGLSVITSTIILAGCGQESYEKQHYILNTQRASSVVASNSANIIEIRTFTSNSAFSAKGLIYRVDEFEYKSDFYNEFLVSPTAMITEKTRNWLSTSGLFRRVLNSTSYIDPTHVIEGNVIALYGDFRAKSSPKAVMEIRIFLLETKTGKEPVIVFGKTYKSSVGLESEDPGGLISALDRCLIEILTNLEEDLVESLP